MAKAKKQTQAPYHEEYKLHCVTCGGSFTRIFSKPPRDEAEATARQHRSEGDQQCPFCSRFRPI